MKEKSRLQLFWEDLDFGFIFGFILVSIMVIGVISVLCLGISSSPKIVAQGELMGKYKEESCYTYYIYVDDIMVPQESCHWDYYFIIDETPYEVNEKAYTSFNNGDYIEIWSNLEVHIQ